MKTTFKKIISIVLSLVMLLSVMSVSFEAFAEQTSTAVSMPDIQTLLTDGKALCDWLEGNFLDLEQADILLADNMDSIAASLSPQLTDLYYYMGYNEADYPADLESLEICFAKALSSLSDKMFREPEPIETIDMSLLYNFAFIDGTEYVDSLNAVLPKEAKFDTSSPILNLTDEQKASLSEYYAKWKAGALKLTGFEIKDYLGEVSAKDFLKYVLLAFIADDTRLPSITKTALNFEFTSDMKKTAAKAVVDILDNLDNAPVSALLRQLSDKSFHSLLKNLLEVANQVTVNTDYYAYKLFSEGIYRDTNGELVPFVNDNGDGTYTYKGPTIVSEYLEAADALFDFLDGLYDDIVSDGVLQTVFERRLGKLSALADAALDAAFATVNSQQAKLQSDIDCAKIEIRVANAKIAEIDSGTLVQQKINNLKNQIASISAEISALQDRLNEIEDHILSEKGAIQGYFDEVAAYEAGESTDEDAYLVAKQKTEELEQNLQPFYSEAEQINSQIKEKSAQADVLAKQIAELESEGIEDEKAVWQKVITKANKAISDKTAELAELPSNELTRSVFQTVSPLITSFFKAFEGVYGCMIDDSPIKAAVKLVYGLENFANTVDDIDWDAIAPVTDPIFEQIDGYINSFAGAYIGVNGGSNLLGMLSETANTFLNQYGVFNYINTDYLNTFVLENVLADNCEIMKMAASALGELFTGVEPTYDSIVSCLIPFLSAFDLGAITDFANIGNTLQNASPSAFAYLAGLESSNLESGYLTRINASLRENGYTGTSVTPLISLSSSSANSLLNYVNMEANGYSLQEIAQAGFNWKNYTGNANQLDIANAFVKIALGDANKLGEIAEAPGLGAALVNLLCDLLNDIKTKPVDTILTKLSDAEGLSAIADFAFYLFCGSSEEYKSKELYDNFIRFDKDGNTTFYDAYIDGKLEYTGPRFMGYIIPVAFAAIDLFSGIDADIKANDGDLLKTILYDKLPQLKNLIQSAIAYTDENGQIQAGAIFYLLLGLEDYAKAQNAAMCYELLESLDEFEISKNLEAIEASENEIRQWQAYLDQIKPLSDAAKLQKAKELGIFDESVTVFDEDALNTAIEEKIQALAEEVANMDEQLTQARADVAELTPRIAELSRQANDLNNWISDAFWEDSVYSDLDAIFSSQDASLIAQLREDFEDEFNSYCGEGSFDEFVNDIINNLADYDYEDAAGDFIDDFTLYDGVPKRVFDALNEDKAELQRQLAGANAIIKDLEEPYETKTAEYEALESGATLAAINEAGTGQKIYISDPDLNAEGYYNATKIEETIATIESEDIAGKEAENEVLRASANENKAQKEEAYKQASGFNFALIPLASSAAEAIAGGLVDFLAGKAADGSENVYNYIMKGDIEGILTSPGRLQSLFEMIVGIYAPALNALVSQGMLSEQTAQQLIAAVPSFDEFYANELDSFPEDFKANPVPATAALINAFCETILTGFDAVEDKNADTKQIQRIDGDIAALFSKDSGSRWNDSYSKSIITRTGEIYQLVVDILGLSFIKDLIGDTGGKGAISGKVDAENLFAPMTVKLLSGTEVVDQIVIEPKSDGAFKFESVEQGNYSLSFETVASVPYVISEITVNAEMTTNLARHRDELISTIDLPVGDLNGDGEVTVIDIGYMLKGDNYGSANTAYDINCDGVVDMADLSIMLSSSNYMHSQVKEQY